MFAFNLPPHPPTTLQVEFVGTNSKIYQKESYCIIFVYTWFLQRLYVGVFFLLYLEKISLSLAYKKKEAKVNKS